jgi:hypothetical protein
MKPIPLAAYSQNLIPPVTGIGGVPKKLIWFLTSTRIPAPRAAAKTGL